MHRFDKDGDGTVDVVEFTKMFFKMGFDERARRAKEKREAEAVRNRVRGGWGELMTVHAVVLLRHIKPCFPTIPRRKSREVFEAVRHRHVAEIHL